MNLIPHSLDLVGIALARTLLAALWQDALLAAAAAASLAALAGRTAALRHTVGLLFLVAMVAVPLAQFTLDAPSAVLQSLADSPSTVTAMLTPGTPLQDLADRWMVTSINPPAWLATIWAGGVALMLIRLCGGLWFLRSPRYQSSLRVPPAVQQQVDKLRQAIKISRPVIVRILDTIDLPFSAYALRPVIWLPATMLTRLSPAHLEALLAHELAHIRRLDWLWNGLQSIIEALLFFHPAAWWLSGRVRVERENACDDIAAAITGNGLIVAEALAALETHHRATPPRMALAASNGKLLQRVARLLKVPQRSTMRASFAGLATALIGAVSLLSLSTGIAALPTTADTPTVATPQTSTTDPSSNAAPKSSAAQTGATETDPWWTKVGDSMDLKDNSDGHLREYHSWTDLHGERHETYRVDGQLRPVDDEVHHWLAEHHKPPAPPAPPALAKRPSPPAIPAVPEAPASPTALATPQALAAPAAPAAPDPIAAPQPAAAPQPPPPPQPPAPPRLSDDPAVKAVVGLLEHDAGTVDRLGTPITLVEDCGPCRIDDQSLSLHLSASGPKGKAKVFVEARRVDGQWRLTTIDLKSPGLFS